MLVILLNPGLSMRLFAQQNDIKFDCISVEQGLSQSYVYSIIQVLQLTRSHHSAESICEILGRSMHTIRQYLRLLKNFHPELTVNIPGKVKKTNSRKLTTG